MVSGLRFGDRGSGIGIETVSNRVFLWRSELSPKLFFLLFTFYFLFFTITGCAPTYPKTKIKESIIRICKNEYQLDVKVHITGKTIAIYLPLDNLIDFTFSITKSASEKINNVILSVSRVALSTDAEFDFYCIIAHDIRIPEVQIVIIKSVDDVKRFLLNDISRSEYSKRMIVDIRLSPQAQKEHAIKEVFDRMKLDKRWQEDVMEDFFRSEPAGLSDIGYWNSRFYIKDISTGEFLAEQIASRIKMDFKEEKTLSENFLMKSAKGAYISKAVGNFMRLEVFFENKFFGDAGQDELIKKAFATIIGVAAHVLHNYNFNRFDYVEIVEQRDKRYLKISRDDLERFRTKSVKLEELMQ